MLSLKRLFRRLRGVGSDNPIRGQVEEELTGHVRMLTRGPGLTTVAVLSLALGIGATSTIFSVLNAAVLRQLQFREPDRLVFIQEFDPEGGREGRPRALTFLAWKEQNRTFEQMVLGKGAEGGMAVSATGETE